MWNWNGSAWSNYCDERNNKLVFKFKFDYFSWKHACLYKCIAMHNNKEEHA